jgi:predicted unusual protein kinase regulating ubiquinone biosynthesis (AarF/ABC1/UbiB family)
VTEAQEEARGAYGGTGAVFNRAVGRSTGETREAWRTLGGETLGPAALARLADLGRSQAFLWTGATLTAGERFGRAVPDGLTPARRTAVIGTVAAELWSGYASLRWRERRTPSLVTRKDWELQHRRGANRVLDAAVALGGTLIKGCQFASTRPDLLPRVYTETLSQLQDRVPPRPYPIIRAAVERELGRPLNEVFSSFSPQPVAAASIAQVHKAYLRDGREVAVKVRYPEVQRLVEADLKALGTVARSVESLEPSVRLEPIVNYLRRTLPLELDLRREAEAARELKASLAHRKDVVVPEVVGEYNTEGLLVLGFEDGVKITDLDGISGLGLDPHRVAEVLVDLYSEQIMVSGVLHADPHPGNIFVRASAEGEPVFVLLDHGLTVPVSPEVSGPLGEAILAITEGDFEALREAMLKAGLDLEGEADLETLLGVAGVLLGGEMAGEPPLDGASEPGPDLSDLGPKLGASIGGIPFELLIVGRAVGLVDGIARRLDPNIDVPTLVAQRAPTA